MSGYATSTDYERLWTLRQSGAKILGRWIGRGDRSFAESYGEFSDEQKDYVIESWKNGTYQFIDPASQQRTSKEAAADELYACVCGFLQLPTNDNAVFFQRYQRWTEQAKKIIRDIKDEKVQLEEWEDVTGKEMLLRLRAFPDMLEALEKIAEYGDCFAHKIGQPNPHQMVMDALKKARGEA